MCVCIGKCFGRTIAFEELTDSKYLSSRDGSTAAELVSALELAGLKGRFHSFIPISTISASATPFILRLRLPGTAGPSGHWVLFHGMQHGEFLIYDPPDTMESLGASELLALWDGSGISVKKSLPSAIAPASGCVALIGAVLFLLQLGLVKVRLGVVAVPVAAIVVALVVHVSAESGFLASREAIAICLRDRADTPIEVVGKSQFEEMCRKGCEIVDARSVETFNRGSIPGAINIPIDSGFLRLRQLAAKLNPTGPVVVYCQSDKCPWAAEVAHALRRYADRDIYVYRGGYVEWLQGK